MRLGELGAVGTGACEITRASGFWMTSWSCVSRRRVTNASYIVRVDCALDSSALSLTRMRFCVPACFSACARLPCSEPTCARATTTSFEIDPARRLTSVVILSCRSRFCVSIAAILGWRGPYFVESSDSCAISEACCVRNCTISGDARICETSAVSPAFTSAANAVVGRLLLRQVGFGEHELVADRGDLLIGERRAVSRFVQIVVGLVALHRGFVGLELVRELLRAVDEPGRRLVADRALGLDLILDIGVDQRVGDQRGLIWIARGERHGQRRGQAFRCYREMLQERIDDLVALASCVGSARIAEPVARIDRVRARPSRSA